VAGDELAKRSIKSKYDQFVNGVPALGAEHNYHTDAALWAQGWWKPRRSLRFVAAGRLSHNEINNSLDPDVRGFGSLVTGRPGAIYTPSRPFVFKAIYANAFKDPTDTEKFGGYVFPRFVFASVLNFGLRPEKVNNTELS